MGPDRWWGVALLWLLGPWQPPPVRGDESIQFNRDVRPILSDKCFACHGFDAKKREADLRLDTAEGAFGETNGSRAIVPGQPEESELWARITADDESIRMPPVDSHKQLSDEEIGALRRWIEAGAPYQKHWSFEPPVAVVPPALPREGRNAIDAFVADRLQREGWHLAAEASKPILIRRVAFALTGLPPSEQELSEYLADTSADAYEKMVDRYLASSHYGEEMARHWLDVARYADTHGLHLDNERQMWAYRDWVVKSFNCNQPFDQFTIEQLAGDLLPEPTTDQLIATGFNRCNVTTSEGGSIDAEFYYRYAVDRTSTAIQAWMGLTAGCAVCHDHKFDPISIKEFYSLYAFFNSAADPAMDGNAMLTNPVLKLASESDRQKLAEFDRQLSDLQAQLEAEVAQLAYEDPATSEPRPMPTQVENVWLDDEFPAGGKRTGGPGHETQFVSRDDGDPVFSGQRALKRTDGGLSQDVWEEATSPLLVPQNAKLFAHVYLDPSNLPRAIMLQFHKGGWLHRAVWGDYDVIPWGKPNSTEKVSMGELPAAGEWVRLEIPAEKLGLAPGDALTGFALTQHGGSVLWDQVGVSGIIDPATDPLRSFDAWWRTKQGAEKSDLPDDLKDVAKGGPEAKPSEVQRQRLLRHYLANVCTQTKSQIAPIKSAIDKARADRKAYDDAIPSTFIYKDLPQPRDSFVMLRGQYDQPGEKVEPGVPQVFPPLQRADQNARPTRLDLAHWLLQSDNPLTARVAVNRFWQQFFGVGLVKTSGDFGTQGELPSHPELLDWLAVYFRESGWNVKDLVRLIVTSATFRQQSSIPPEVLEHDPENRLLAHAPRLRLDAEQIRDNALFVSGLMDMQSGGKGVKPYQPPNIWEPVGFVGSNTRFYQQDSGEALYRRSLYTFYKRTAPPPFMVNFDAPNREQICTRRERSNTPLQALQLLNDVQHVEAARGLAQRALHLGTNEDAVRLRYIYRVVLAREPLPTELAVVQRQLDEHRQRYQSAPADAELVVSQGVSTADPRLPVTELAAYTLVASTVLNLDETLMRN
jgi:mono/diheme cytochrome c family protein